ncbi:unnamed protein product [Camellia sinensis]
MRVKLLKGRDLRSSAGMAARAELRLQFCFSISDIVSEVANIIGLRSQTPLHRHNSVPKNQVHYSPETASMRSLSTCNPLKLNDDLQRDGVQYEENNRSYKTPPPSIVEPSKDRSQNVFDASTMMRNEIDLVRTKLNADEQMCCDCCRIPIIDYHRHCANCSYDLCLSCCQDLREASIHGVKGELENQLDGRTEYKITVTEQVKQSKLRLKLSDKFFNWKANSNGSIPCPSKEYGSCGCLSLTLKRIFKMNWVAKLKLGLTLGSSNMQRERTAMTISCTVQLLKI